MAINSIGPDRNVETVDTVELADRRTGGSLAAARKFVGRKRPRVPGGLGLIIRESQNPGKVWLAPGENVFIRVNAVARNAGV